MYRTKNNLMNVLKSKIRNSIVNWNTIVILPTSNIKENEKKVNMTKDELIEPTGKHSRGTNPRAGYRSLSLQL